jgi:pilus assembly protein CpaC
MTAAALDSKEVIVFANGAGTSSLFVWNEDGRYQRIKINIVAGDTSRVAREVAAFLTGIPQAKASVVGDKVIVEGDNLSDADLAKIDMLEKRYPQVVNFTNRVGWEQMVMMDVKVVEFPKSELRDIGLKWTPSGGATLAGIWNPIRRGSDGPYTVNIPVTGTTSLPVTGQNPGDQVRLPSALNILSGVNLGLNAQLNLLEQNGKASVLAEPQLSARNGAKAGFLAGGEFPYSVSNLTGTTIIFKPYGIRLDITPKVDRNGVIRATIQAEVSSIDASVTTTGGPALLSRKTDTEFNVRNGETMVLSGLLQRNSSTDIDKVPLLGDIPVLGALFRSKRFQNKETELVVFVTPTVVDSQSPGLVDRVARTTERLEQQMGPRPYLSEPLQPGAAATQFNVAPPGAPASAIPVTAPGPNPVLIPVPNPGPIAAPVTGVISGEAKAPTMLAADSGLLQVTFDSTALHASPSASSPILLQLGRGAVVQYRDRPAPPQLRNFWRAVNVGGIEGWVANRALVPLKSDQPLRPNRKSDPVHIAQQGQPVSPGGITAARPEAVERADGAALPRYQVLLDGLAVRVTPDINALAVLQLNSGSVVEGLPEQPRGYWRAVQVAGKRGWVATQWLMPQP